MKKFNTVNCFDFHLPGFVWQAYLILLTEVHVSAFGKLIQLYDHINNETQNQNENTFPWNYRKSSIKHPPGGLFISNTLGGGDLVETEGLFNSTIFVKEGRGLFNLAKTMVSVLHKGLEYRVKAQVQEVGGHAAEGQKHSKLPVGE